MCYKIATLDNLTMGTAMRPPQQREDGAAQRAASSALRDIEECAARCGITLDRLFKEIRRVAFSDLSRIADWRPGEEGLQVKPSKQLHPDDAAAVAEIIASASTGRIYRIKVHDKTPGLALAARCIGVFLKAASARNGPEPTQEEIDSARERLIDALDRLAAEAAAGSGDPEAAS
jgi:hypothetical protein